MYRRLRLVKTLFLTTFVTLSVLLLLNRFNRLEILDDNPNAVSVPYAWQNVSFSTKTYVFSAFANDNKVTIIGATDQFDLSFEFYCHFFYDDKVDSQDKPCTGTVAELNLIHESHRMRYSAAFYKCSLPTSTHPNYVSLTQGSRCKAPSNIIPILYQQQQRRQRDFTVCVGPLHYRYNRAYELVEMIELNRLLGANHFIFYNYSTNYNVDQVFQHYKKKGLVNVYQWKVPLIVDTLDGKTKPEIHYFAQLALVNDCIYRNMYVSKYVVVQDLDEFIIPGKHLTWKRMLQKLPKVSSYMFHCVFFRKDWPDTKASFSGKNHANRYKLNTLLKQNREKKIFPRTQRTKYIVDPLTIDMAGIHFVWRFKKGSLYYVDPTFAKLHHYRNLHNLTDVKAGTQDDRIMAYKDNLISNTRRVWEALEDVPLGPTDDAF